MRDDCLYCGAKLEPRGHWAHCPVCEPEWFPPAPRPPADPLADKGRPTRNGVRL